MSQCVFCVGEIATSKWSVGIGISGRHAENAFKELYSHISAFHKSGEEWAQKKKSGPIKGQCIVSEDVSIIIVLEIIVCLY